VDVLDLFDGVSVDLRDLVLVRDVEPIAVGFLAAFQPLRLLKGRAVDVLFLDQSEHEDVVQKLLEQLV